MLDFSSDKKFMEFTIDGTEPVYKLPYLQYLPAEEGRRLAEFAKDKNELAAYDWQFETLEKYCPGLTSRISIASANDILNMWFKGSTVSLGE